MSGEDLPFLKWDFPPACKIRNLFLELAEKSMYDVFEGIVTSPPGEIRHWVVEWDCVSVAGRWVEFGHSGRDAIEQ